MIVSLVLLLVVAGCSTAEPPPPTPPGSAEEQIAQGKHLVFSAPGGTFTYEAHEHGRLLYSARTTYDLKTHSQVARVRYNPPGSSPVVKILVKQVHGHSWVQFLRGPYRGCWMEGSYASSHGVVLLSDELISPLEVVRSLRPVKLRQNEVRATASTNAVMALVSQLRKQYGAAPKSSRTPVTVDVYGDRLVYRTTGAGLGRALVRSKQASRKEIHGARKTKLVTIVLPAEPFNTRITAPKPDTLLRVGDFVPGTLQLRPGAGCH